MNGFKPINKTTISSEIVDQLLSMIRSGGLNPGDKLPSERQLIELVRMGRSSMREVLKRVGTLLASSGYALMPYGHSF